LIAVDSSILVGRIRAEADVMAIEIPGAITVAAPAVVEVQAWCAHNLPDGRSAWLERLLNDPRVQIDSFTPAMAQLAGDALRTMGRGTGHPARLNFGDAMVYAHARATNLKLLCKGNDFSHTDIDLDPRSIRLS
jgi:ribonuclease VapC